MVECQLPKLDVAGSNPVSRSRILYNPQLTARRFCCAKSQTTQDYKSVSGALLGAPSRQVSGGF